MPCGERRPLFETPARGRGARAYWHWPGWLDPVSLELGKSGVPVQSLLESLRSMRVQHLEVVVSELEFTSELFSILLVCFACIFHHLCIAFQSFDLPFEAIFQPCFVFLLDVELVGHV